MYVLIILQLLATPPLTTPNPFIIPLPHKHVVEGGEIHYNHGTGVFVPATPRFQPVVIPDVRDSLPKSSRYLSK